jgi:hypothetical protein
MKLIATLICSLFLAGCSTGQQYKAYADAQSATAQAEHNANAERYRALGAIAQSGSDVAKVAAVMALSASGGPQGQKTPGLAMPVSDGQLALQWASILVPGVTQAWGISQQVKLGMRQSDNSTALGMSTNAAFVGMASQIQAPAANMTLSGTGVLGSGSYTIGANSGQNSGNSGRLAGGAITDNTSTPTVVTQPAPIVVTQPAPVIVKPEVVTTTTTNNTSTPVVVGP